MYQEAFFLLLPLRETSANKTIVEALACGLPIVANDVEAFPIATKTLYLSLRQKRLPPSWKAICEIQTA
jgi:hypothetical protein